MRGTLQDFCDENDPRARELSARMTSFYAQVENYDAFSESSHLPQFWAPILASIRLAVARHGQCRVLEFGAGRTGFAGSLADLRSKVVFEVQDISPQNLGYLRGVADRVHIDDVLAMGDSYDVVFSTFAWEHVTRPGAILKHLLALLGPRGRLFIACPRYDFPFYLSPSARRLPRAKRLLVACWLAWRRALTLLTGRAAFILHVEPAALHGPWFRDSDAVHWASLWDLQCALPDGWRLKRLRVPAAGLPGRFWERYLLLFVEISRSGIPGQAA